MMIGWVFLDVGNILIDEDPLTYFVFGRHVEAVRRVHPHLSFAELLARRETRALAGSAWPVFDVVSSYLDDRRCAELWAETEGAVKGQFAALSPLIPGAAELVDRLARRYRLGLIANQGEDGRDRLAALGLLDRFEVVMLSEREGLSKPDPGLFRRAIERAGACASECLMVGDRLDNDLAPAASLGMAGAWVRWPRRAAKGWDPAEPEAVAYLDSLQRVSARTVERWGHLQPTLVVDEVSQLDAAIAAAFEHD
jgi:5'-nucleotidase